MTYQPEAAGSTAGQAALLDIGGDVGAIVVRLSAMPASGELEACPHGRPDERFHTGVHQRQLSQGVALLAIFPAVDDGIYDILDSHGGAITSVRVLGGQVTEVDLTHTNA